MSRDRLDHSQVALLSEMNLDADCLQRKLVVILRKVHSEHLVDLRLVFVVHFNEVLNVFVVGEGKLGVGKDRGVELHDVHLVEVGGLVLLFSGAPSLYWRRRGDVGALCGTIVL